VQSLLLILMLMPCGNEYCMQMEFA